MLCINFNIELNSRNYFSTSYSVTMLFFLITNEIEFIFSSPGFRDKNETTESYSYQEKDKSTNFLDSMLDLGR